jgi:hypothetical protein
LEKKVISPAALHYDWAQQAALSPAGRICGLRHDLNPHGLTGKLPDATALEHA